MADVASQVAYPTVAQVLNRARAFVNDSFQGGAGRILTNQAAFSTEYINAALEDIQDRIGANNITLIKDNVFLGPLLPIAAPNPATQVYVDYTGFYNGTLYQVTPPVVLPSDCIAVLECWEQQTGSGQPFAPMTQPMYGLPSTWQGPGFGFWEWRQDRINMLGATASNTLRIRYESRYSPIAADNASTSQSSTPNDNWQTTQIKILASVNALAHVVAYFYARARGSQFAPLLQTDGEKYALSIVRRYVRRDQATPYYRQAYGQPNKSINTLGSGGLGGN